jgi:hypothetical protein
MGKSTISMAIFNSYVSLPEAINFHILCVDGSNRVDSLQLVIWSVAVATVDLTGMMVNCNGESSQFCLISG